MSLYNEIPDVLLSDVRMPNGTGLELLKRVKNSQFSHLIVVLMSGFADVREAELSNAGAFSYFKKPFNFKELVQIIDQVELSSKSLN